MPDRDYYFDNARFILITLIIAGHLLEPSIYSIPAFRGAYTFLYIFHIPAFVVISGHFAKNIRQKGKLRRIFMRTVPSYILLQTAYAVLLFYLNGDSRLNLNFIRPIWVLWYLPALFLWYLMLLVISRLRFFPALICSLLISLSAGLSSWIGYDFTLSRALVFFPYYLVGYYLDIEQLRLMWNKHARALAVTISVAALGFTLYYATGFNPRVLYGSSPYSFFNVSPLEGMATRTGTYAAGFLMVLVFFSLVPRGRLFFTSMGARSIYAYVLHGALLLIMRRSRVYDYIDTGLMGFLLLALALALAFLLTSRTVERLAWPLVRPADLSAWFSRRGKAQ